MKTLIYSIGLVCMFSCSIKSKQDAPASRQASEALAVLRSNMETQPAWLKVHAAEFLLWSGHPEGVKAIFLNENRLYSDSVPYRIGIWRVLAQAETEPQQKEAWINKIKKVFSENETDRLHAIETLAKLRVPAWGKEVELSDILSDDPVDNFAVYKLWNFASTSDENSSIARDSLLKLSISTDQSPAVRIISAYALKKIKSLEEASWTLLAESALSELVDTSVQTSLLNAAILTANEETEQTNLYKQIKKMLISLQDKEDTNNIRMSLLDALAEKGNTGDLDRVFSIFDKIESTEDAASADVLLLCAYAILRILER